MFTRYVLKVGDVGIAVNKMQAYLNIMQARGYIKLKINPDGIYGSATQNAVKEYQRFAKIAVDGTIGDLTWSDIVDRIKSFNMVTNIPVASSSYYLKQGDSGLDVFKHQEYLNQIAEFNACLRPVPVDGSFGSRTKACVAQFQYLYDLTNDGEIGKNTWDAIINTRNHATK
ncbi:MAG: peptidoglycan-binding protein [Erysipelotrichaceae bacterium]